MWKAEFFTTELSDLINDSKQKYFLSLSQKLNTLQKSTKAY